MKHSLERWANSMEQFLNFISQNYFYIPASIIGVLAIIIPAIVKIAKICTSNTANAIKIAKIKKQVVELENNLLAEQEGILIDLENEKNYLLERNSILLNKKEIALNQARIETIGKRIAEITCRKTTLIATREAEQELEKANKKKVRVKVVKNVAEKVKE